MGQIGNSYRITTAEIGHIVAENIFARMANRMGIDESRLLKVFVEFENGPESAEYTVDELRRTLDLMTMSCSEADILRKLKIVQQYRGHLPAAWKDLVLFDGNGNYLVHDIWLDEIMAVTLAKHLHGREENREEHSVVVLRREDLPSDWLPSDTIELEFMMDTAFMVINHNNVYMLSTKTRQFRTVKLGNVYIADREQRDVHSFAMYSSTRLWPEMPT
jgi:hypothetical protein